MHSWSETGRPLSMSSVITISQPPVVPGDRPNLEPLEGITFAPAPDSDEDTNDFEDSYEEPPVDPYLSPSTSVGSSSESPIFKRDGSESDTRQTLNGEQDDEAKQKARVGSLEKLQGGSRSREDKDKDAVTEKERKEREEEREEDKDKLALHPVRIKPRRRSSRVPEAIIVLKEEKVSVASYEP